MSEHGSLPEAEGVTAEDRWRAYQFLLPSASEIRGILREDWVEPDSLKAKDTILRLLGWRQAPPTNPRTVA